MLKTNTNFCICRVRIALNIQGEIVKSPLLILKYLTSYQDNVIRTKNGIFRNLCLSTFILRI